MSIFVKKPNLLTGKVEWEVQPEDYDYHQEIARASFADMLHDSERNAMYEIGLRKAIEKMHANKQKANVLDIGTGTGLLSMMAVRHGADSVIACEAFKPMSECALKVIKRNGFEDKIKVIPKRSLDLTVGPNGDLKERCNILVTEVFDTELIGEGAVATFVHAQKFLLENYRIVVPHCAKVYAQVVESKLVQNWNTLEDIINEEGDILLNVPATIRSCEGSAAVHDLQLNQLDRELFKTLTAPASAFTLEFSTGIIGSGFGMRRLPCLAAGTSHAVLVWWELQMDTDGATKLSCAPYWAHPSKPKNGPADLPWRDHWMQAIYYTGGNIEFKTGDLVTLFASLANCSMWFDVRESLDYALALSRQPQHCSCDLHIHTPRTRIGQLNQSWRNSALLAMLEQNVRKDSVVLVLGHGFYLSLVAVKFGAKKVYYIEDHSASRRIFKDFINTNHLDRNVEVFDSVEALQSRTDVSIDLVVGEPYFQSSVLPWDNLLFTYRLRSVRHLLSKTVEIFPKIGKLMAIAVKFDHLHKIRTPVGSCQEFDMQDFDSLIMASSAISDPDVEPQPLWEYPGLAVSKEEEIFTFDLNDFSEDRVHKTGALTINLSEDKVDGCNGVAIWMEWDHSDSSSPNSRWISTGPREAPKVGEYVKWDEYTRQGVCLFPTRECDLVNYEFNFNAKEGSIRLKCGVDKQ